MRSYRSAIDQTAAASRRGPGRRDNSRTLTRIIVVSLILLLQGWLLSGWYHFGWVVWNQDRQSFSSLGLEIASGGVSVYNIADKSGLSGWSGPPPGWVWKPAHGAPRWKFWFHCADTSAGLITKWSWFIPLWIFLPLCAVIYKVFSNQARSVDACPCGYSRAGLRNSAPCPECGAADPAGEDR